jgi:hypothetical protein
MSIPTIVSTRRLALGRTYLPITRASQTAKALAAGR